MLDERRSLALRLVLAPWPWALLCLGAAWFMVLADTDALDFPRFLLMLIGGWCCGFGIVSATLRMRPVRLGVIMHVVAGIAAGFAAWLLVETAPQIGDLAEPVRAVVVVVQMAAIPAAGWIWFGLVSRVSSTLLAKEKKKAEKRVGPVWSRENDASVLRFPAVPMRMRTLTQLIVGIVVVLGAVAVALMIATDDLAERLGPRLVIIALGILLGLPGYFALAAALRRRTVDVVLTVTDDRLRLDAGAHHLDVALTEIDLLRWRTESEYARLEVRTAAVQLSLLAGMARVPKGAAAALPALPKHVRRRLELIGMVKKSARGGGIEYRLSPVASAVRIAKALDGRGASGLA